MSAECAEEREPRAMVQQEIRAHMRAENECGGALRVRDEAIQSAGSFTLSMPRRHRAALREYCLIYATWLLLSLIILMLRVQGAFDVHICALMSSALIRAMVIAVIRHAD